MRLHWPTKAVALVIALSFAFPAMADDPDKSKAQAALALAKAKREREAAKSFVKVVAPAPAPCHTDYDTAAKRAAELGKPLVLWVGMNCEDKPSLRNELGEAIHCHVSTYAKDTTPRVAIQGGDGNGYFALKEKIDGKTAGKIKAAWAKPAQPPLIRGDVGISEEIRLYTPPIYTGYSGWFDAPNPQYVSTGIANPPRREPLLPGRRASFYQGMTNGYAAGCTTTA